MLNYPLVIAMVALTITASSYPPANITDMLTQGQYMGQWQSNSDVKVIIIHPNLQQFNFLTESQGDAFMKFMKNESGINEMFMVLLNPTYQEGRTITLRLNLTNYNTMSWIEASTITYEGSEKFKEQIAWTDCLAQYSVVVTPSDSIHITVQGESFDFSTTMTKDPTVPIAHKQHQNYQIQVILYCAFVVLVCGVQFVCVTKLCKEFLENDADVNRISMITVGFITIYDAYLCLQNLYFALLNYVHNDTNHNKMYFQYFIIPAFFYFLLATTSDMKLIWIVWRSRYIDIIFDNQQMRRAITYFFVQFYSGLIIFFILMYFLALENWFILATTLFITPQIVHNVRNGNNPKFLPKYIFGVIFSNVFFQLYFRGCPKNFQGLIPSPLFCTLWAASFAIQTFLLYIQYRYGPRSFIPRCFLPKQYNYYHSVNRNQVTDEGEDCAICLGDVTLDGDSKHLLPRLMITPCKHKFHIPCLKSWMEVKLQCPTCRKPLPALQE